VIAISGGPGSSQMILLRTMSAVARPAASRAAVKRGRSRMIRQVASSSEALPLEARIRHALGRPSGATISSNSTAPARAAGSPRADSRGR
jgi:hypothetical protein